MKIFTSLYDQVLKWSRHRLAERYLAIISFAESSFFPVPVVLMMAPMMVAKPERRWYLATLTTITSVLGGIAGYLIGALLFDSVGQWIIEAYHAGDKVEQLKDWFAQYGVWLVLLAGVSPIPYKLVTISAGALGLAWLPFVIGSLVGRSFQFFFVAGIVHFGGENLEDNIRRWSEWLGWGVLALAAVAIVVIKVL
ncbi:MAG: membrane protein YqaA with SNARE-associated domain [Saprospiraceae bacterium]|jgi:membrane protein YqaA with SNARE-associated domain